MAPRLRQAVRGLLLDQHHHVLLVRFEFPRVTVWALPGGGLDEGETAEAGLRRELHEEVGLAEFEFGAHIWNREHVVPLATGHDGQRDRIHLVHVERFEPEPTIGWERLRAEHVNEVRWWSIPEIRSATSVEFAPRALGRLVTELVDRGLPPEPIDTGI